MMGQRTLQPGVQSCVAVLLVISCCGNWVNLVWAAVAHAWPYLFLLLLHRVWPHWLASSWNCQVYGSG